MKLVFEWLSKVWNIVLKVFTTKLFQLGTQELSLIMIVQLIVMAIVTLYISRKLQDVIKRRVLTRFGLDRGTREALSSLIGYVLTVLGFLIVLQTAGINLSSLTVFAGAMGIGLGFGLQNLTANFISGLAILFEKPIKVGDYVKVDDLSGTVEKISIRSTTIRTNDGVFVIVPNTSFLENNVVNWSYEDPRARLRIPVDVPDESDPVIVTEVLLEAARKEPEVLPSPAPEVYFKGFGDGMDFELLVWIDNPPNMESIQSSLYYLIEEQLREQGIEHAEPQRDLYIRNLKDLEFLLQKPQQTGAGNGSYSQEESLSNKAVPAAKKNKVKANSRGKLTLRDLLRKVSYFEKCSDSDLRHIIQQGYRQMLKAGDIICEENDPGDSFYIILSGLVEVFVESIGKRVATRKPGEFIGEMSLLLGTPRTATLRALEDTILFVVDRENLKSLLAKHKDLADQISEELFTRKETLEQLGIKVGGTQEKQTGTNQIRQRIQSLFGI
ncbi:MAG: mechanosensitive ion channel [Moorea sp. SIO1G6]|uniref:mechanosensitive ion channel domain-containing protein n=1 Tax=Moorena sp. SIO1G6 TaxID=2607840 RepID=UPI0013C0EBEF|nr:mechanosensitive ion channel domain-containing protein [Moorena sp. SIO1G6]NES82081.1 mechanosensitive ion channel [Moorena sp. SIO2B7]NET67900.1 mechanosensitive ion channel [Moorena sp. SIO1G6]